ncbi:MAG TPA: hypothetical protein VH062_04040 [Polyangiaceae bacterium]|jgi:hypothetical protein|nr:hypothetical protein [Polyangiaceae bacterium]
MRSSLPVCTAAAAAAAAAALLLAATTASAEGGDSGPDYDPGKALRRSDFAAGISTGGAFGTAGGYPNDANKIGIGRYHADTGAAGGISNTFWVGAAMRDWLVLGVGLSGSTVAGSGTISTGGAFVFHVETFPLFYQGGVFHDLALVGDFGLGGRTINRASSEVASGGAMSFASLGFLWETFRAGKHFSSGPILQVTEQFSDTMNSTLVVAGFQLAYYGGPT